MKLRKYISGACQMVLAQALAIFLLTFSVLAQFETATVLGTIRDANDAVVEGATVTLKNIETGNSSNISTDSNGDFQFINVKIGTYQLTIEKQGFNKLVADKINIKVNARQRVDLRLQVATTTETVFVTDVANPLQTDSSEVGQVIQRQQIIQIPLNGRSYANLALLAPGVRESHTNS